jgi:hypothetical protein
VLGAILAFFLCNAGIIALVQPVPIERAVLTFYLPLAFITTAMVSCVMPQTGPTQTLLVKSRTCRTAVLHMTCEGQRDRMHSACDPHSHGVGDGPPRINQQSQHMVYVGGEFRRLT